MRNTVFKRLLSIAAVLAMTSPIAVDAIEIDNIEYQFVDEQAMVLGYHPGTSTSFNLVIPDYVSYDGDDYPVRQIISGRVYCTDSSTPDETLTSVTIGQNVTNISASAFDNCTKLTTVNWADYSGANVQILGNNCFRDCTSLTSLWIPTGISEVPSGCCVGCTALKSVYIASERIKSIGRNAFASCTSLSYVSLSAPNLEVLNDFCFNLCSDLTSIVIPDNVTTIKEYAFNECRSLTGIHLPRNLRQISYNAFRYTNALTYIEIPDLCEDIGHEAFLYDSKLAKLILPGSLTTLGADAFWSALNYDYTDLFTFSPTLFTDGVTDAFHFQISYPERQNVTLHVPRTLLAQYQAASEWSWAKSIVACDTVFAEGFRHRLNCADKQLTIIKHYLSKDDDTLEVPSSIDLPVGADAAEAYAVTGIGDDVFANNASLRVAKLGDVEVIGARAFQSCNNLQSFEGEKIREVGTLAFDGCSSLHAIILPATVETVRANAFKWCGNITSVTVKAVEPPAAENLFSNSIYGSAKLYVPSESVGAYVAHAEWGRFAEILPIPTYSLGDINQDGNIDGSDVSALLEMVLSGGVTDEQVAVADINSDGAVDGSDVSALLEMVLSGE